MGKIRPKGVPRDYRDPLRYATGCSSSRTVSAAHLHHHADDVPVHASGSIEVWYSDANVFANLDFWKLAFAALQHLPGLDGLCGASTPPFLGDLPLSAAVHAWGAGR